MYANKNPGAVLRKKTGTTIFRWALALVVILIVLVFLLVPVIVSSGRGQEFILAKINDSIEGKADFNDLSMGWLKGIEITDFSFDDPIGQTSLTVKQIAAKPRYASILTGSLSFGRTIINQPRCQINLKPRIPQNQDSDISAARKSAVIVLPVERIDLEVNDGGLKVTDSKARTVELSQINTKVALRPPGQQTNFEIDMNVTGDGPQSRIAAEGRLTPPRKQGWNLKTTSGDVTVEVNDLQLDSLAPFFELAGIEIQAKGAVSANLTSRIKAGSIETLSGTIKSIALNITGPMLKGDVLKTSRLNAVVQMRRQKDLLNIDKLDIDSDWLTAKVTGTVPTTFKSLAEFVKPDAEYNLKASLECDVAAAVSQMPRTFGLKEGLNLTSGRLTAEVETSTENGQKRISGTGRLVGLDGTIEGKRIALSEPVTAVVQLTSDKAGIKYDRLDFASSFAQVNCTGSSKLLNYKADIDLEKLQTQLGRLINTGSLTLAGIVAGEGTLSADGDKINADGSAHIKNLRVVSPQQPPFEQPDVSVAFDCQLNPADETINVRRFELDSAQIKMRKGEFKMDTEGQTTKFEASVSCEYDWSALTTVAAPFLPAGLQLYGRRQDDFSFAGAYPAGQPDKLLAGLNTSGRLGFDRAEYMGLDFGPTDVDIQIQNGLLTIAPFSTKVNNGLFNFAGRADFKSKPPLLETPGPIHIAEAIQINDRTGRKLLTYLNPIFAKALNVSGVADFNCERLAIPLAANAADKLQVIGTISVSNLRLQASDLLGQILSVAGTGSANQNITIHPTRFVLQDGILRYDNMQMDVGNNPVNFKGVIGLDKSLDMTVTLPYTLKGTTARVDKETVGQRISLPLKGTIDKPELDIGRLLEDQLKQKAIEALEKLLK